MGRVLGVDYGEKRVGLAMSDPGGSIAMPLRTVTVTGVSMAVGEVCRAAQEAVPPAERVVVGMPLHMDGRVGAMATQVTRFIVELGKALAIPVVGWDERGSSREVDRVLLAADLSRRRRKQVRDKLAAQVILQAYLDAHACQSGAPECPAPGDHAP